MLDLLGECFVFSSWLSPLKRVFTPHALSSVEASFCHREAGETRHLRNERETGSITFAKTSGNVARAANS